MTPSAPSRPPITTPFIGTWLSLGSPVVAEIAALSGFDWLLLDLEHGAASESSLLANLQAIRGTSALPIVRVGAPHPDLILHALDWGAAGIMVPHIESAAQAEACLRAMHYAPRGQRGLSRSARVYDYGLRPPTEVPPPLFFAQIESLAGIEHVDAIAAVEGVDVLFVGPADLTHDLSAHAHGHAPPFADCLARVVTAARAAGKHPGILVAISPISSHSSPRALRTSPLIPTSPFSASVTASSGHSPDPPPSLHLDHRPAKRPRAARPVQWKRPHLRRKRELFDHPNARSEQNRVR